MWDDILGHEQNKEFLARLLQPGNRPHALLFYGPEGIGKKQLALRFAKTFLCDEHRRAERVPEAARRAAAKLDVYSGCVAAGTPVADDPFSCHSITL